MGYLFSMRSLVFLTLLKPGLQCKGPQKICILAFLGNICLQLACTVNIPANKLVRINREQSSVIWYS